MKITKTQLKKMIQEELSSVNEAGGRFFRPMPGSKVDPEGPASGYVYISPRQKELARMLATAIELISNHQTSMPEPSNALQDSLNTLQEVLAYLQTGE